MKLRAYYLVPAKNAQAAELLNRPVTTSARLVCLVPAEAGGFVQETARHMADRCREPGETVVTQDREWSQK